MLSEYLQLAQNAIWQLLDFMYSGGYVLWSIFFLNIVLWMLVVERHWFFRYNFPLLAEQKLRPWQERKEHQSWYAKSIKTMILAKLHSRLNQHLSTIHVSVELLPILGLLGTVIGMIETFEILNLYGTGNARALAASISKALITTLAGLLSAIPGLFMSSLLQQQAEQKMLQVTDKMTDQESDQK
ncbi:MotA/TolQ/ExbB proton channel family protein [sulfur-oxidizing endosymbiont of Gigantopelta aegis]|uniref:MotA/TolQ/ExbB proton channel family protein n=1 Tax=sulfur-oxidizing endosymbiont of Gigantopelta aegis TaxID=2794934 RepID=UPI0018DBC2B3|nr:MotA/TolQ/ExbB proton channel family protein [sulfur-oxidizing endosymbiont of Gigantopelta aegis]